MDLILVTLWALLVSAQIVDISASESCSARYLDVVSKHVTAVERAVVVAGCDLMPDSRCPVDHFPDSDQSFDFIIVGCGTAGSVLANRLTQVNNWTVLVIEAGDCMTRTNEVPGFFTSCQDSEWDFYTNKDEDNCLAMNDGRCRWPQGKVLGGSSSVGHGVYMRGHRLDYDHWEDAGCKGWDYATVLPFFKMHEKMKAKEVVSTNDINEYHGKSGELSIESWENGQDEILIETIKKAAKELEFIENSDCNGVKHSGYVQLQGLLEDGRRCSAEKAFLQSCLNRTNLLIARNASVQKILINDDGVCYGVEFLKNGTSSRVFATKEVLLTAGAINTAKILMLSGIGPKPHLESLGINCLKDIPVGLNMQDHPMFICGLLTHDCEVPHSNMDHEIYKFLMRNEKCTLNNHGIATNTFLWNSRTWEDDNPDLQLMMFGFQKRAPELLEYLNYWNFNKTIIDYIEEKNYQQPVILLAAVLLKPSSKGRVELVSADANDHPNIICGYYQDYRDIDKMSRALEIVQKLANTVSLREINATFHEVYIKRCSEYAQDSKEYMECYVKHMTTTSISPTYSSTCRMGPEDCGDACVGPELKVRGFDGLRVCDSSAFPSSISGTNTASTLMVAERCARFVKQCYNQTG